MKKSSKVSEAYAEIERLGRGPLTPEVVARIKSAIEGKTGLVVSKAVEVAADNGLQQLVPEMLDAFGRFVDDGAELDKSCLAKTTIVKALNKFEYLGGTIFLAGARYVQYNGLEDTAIGLRSECALALARIVHPEASFVLTDLLVDSQMSVRVAAVKALTHLGAPESEVLLRLKIHAGDKTEVIGECFLGLMTMAPTRSLDFVARYLDHVDGTIAESAALAIGASHLPEALEALLRLWRRNPGARQALLLPIALIRNDAAFDHLLGVVRSADARLAVEAIESLRLFSAPQYVDRLRDVVETRAEPSISHRFAHEFG